MVKIPLSKNWFCDDLLAYVKCFHWELAPLNLFFILYLWSALHVSDVSFPGLHPLCWYLPSWHQTTEFTSWSRNCCAEVVWFWQVGSWLWDFKLVFYYIYFLKQGCCLRKITRRPKVPDHKILGAWHKHRNKKLICFPVAQRQKLLVAQWLF